MAKQDIVVSADEVLDRFKFNASLSLKIEMYEEGGEPGTLVSLPNAMELEGASFEEVRKFLNELPTEADLNR